MSDGPFTISYVPKKVKDSLKKFRLNVVFVFVVFIKTYGDRQVFMGAMWGHREGQPVPHSDQKGVPAGLGQRFFH